MAKKKVTRMMNTSRFVVKLIFIFITLDAQSSVISFLFPRSSVILKPALKSMSNEVEKDNSSVREWTASYGEKWEDRIPKWLKGDSFVEPTHV
jgi:hypothetical protein